MAFDFILPTKRCGLGSQLRSGTCWWMDIKVFSFDHDPFKYKTKPTHPKPFRFRTNERGILMEVDNMEKKVRIVGYKTGTARPFLEGKIKRKLVKDIQGDKKLNDKCNYEIIPERTILGEVTVSGQTIAVAQEGLESAAAMPDRLMQVKKMRSPLKREVARPESFNFMDIRHKSLFPFKRFISQRPLGNNVYVVYTPWTNLRKIASMDVGQVGFHNQKMVPTVKVEKRINDVVNRLNRTKVERIPDLKGLIECEV